MPRDGTITGALAASDSAFSDGTPFHSYAIDGAQGQTLRAAMAASQFDPYVALLRHAGDSLVLVASDDDSGEGLNALLEWPVDRSGAYVLVATVVARSSQGGYVLTVAQGPASAREAFVAAAANAAARSQLGPALTGPHRPITVGQPATGTMGADTPRLDGRGRFHTYRFEGRANQRVVVSLESDNFDPYLYLVRSDGPTVRIVGTDDDSGEGDDARLVATLRDNGEYLVIATTYGGSDSTGTSAYTLRLEPCDDACAAASAESTSPATVASAGVVNAPRRPLPLGTPVQARLAATDLALADGSYFHAYSFDAPAGASLRVSMEASEFDPILVLYRVEGNSLVRVASDDDGGEGFNALLSWTTDRAGSYVIVANSIARGATGAYTITASMGTTSQ